MSEVRKKRKESYEEGKTADNVTIQDETGAFKTISREEWLKMQEGVNNDNNEDTTA